MIIGKKIILSVCALFLFTTFILTIVATAGSTSNYSPINKVYLGEADLSHINVTKVIPSTAPILSVLAELMMAPNASYTEIFGALKTASETAALKPLLSLLADSSNVSATVTALTVLAPLAAGNSSSTALAEVQEVSALIENSNNLTATLEGLEILMATSNSTDTTSQTTVFSLLADSQNATETVESLYTLNSMTLTEKAQLAPVFTIFEESTNATATLEALSTLMTANISSSVASTLMSMLESSSDPESTLSELAGSLPSSYSSSISAVESLLSNSDNVNGTITVLGTLLENNVTSSASAQTAFRALTVMLTEATNQTLVISAVASLATSSTSSATTTQLAGLEDLLVASQNTTETLSILEQVESANSSSSDSAAITSLFSLIENSNNSTDTLLSLLELTTAVQSNPSSFTPLLKVLTTATYSTTTISAATLNKITPIIMDYLNVHSLYRLGIFTICRSLSDGSNSSCNSPHAVQSFYMRDILFDELESSDFKPYMVALGVTKDDLYLKGKLQDKEKDYVPAVRAVLAFNLIAIIFSFFLVVIILFFTLRRTSTTTSATEKLGFWAVWTTRGLTFVVSLLLLLSGAIVAAFVHIIRTDTKDDDYNVTFTIGSPFSGLIWAGFALSFISLILLFLVRSNKRKAGELEEVQDIGPSSSEAGTSEKDHHANIVTTNGSQ